MMEVAASHLFCPMTTLAWQSSLSCVVFGLWALLPSVWPTRLVCVWDWEGAGLKKKGGGENKEELHCLVVVVGTMGGGGWREASTKEHKGVT